MNKVCVYAIAKNEEKNVERWANNVRSADHVIVLDTGSTDRTVELLSSFGFEVHQNTYTHFRFDTARNDCLDLIPEEYNIRVSLDLDEVFEQENWVDILKENWNEEAPRAVYSYVWNHNEDGSNGLVFFINKIHGIDPDLRWVGAVHEHLTFMSTGEKTFTKYVDFTNALTVHHYHDLSKGREWYKDLAYERLQESPDDYLTWMLYGNEEKTKGDPQKAIDAYKYVIDHFQNTADPVELASCFYTLGYCYNLLDDGYNALLSYAAGIAYNKYYRDNYYGMATILIANEMYEMAIGILLEGLEKSERAYSWNEDPVTWSYGMYDALGVAYDNKGDYKNALVYGAKALSYDTQNEHLQNNYNIYLKHIQDNSS